MTTTTLKAGTPAGIALIVGLSGALSAMILTLDPDVAPRVWLGIAMSGLLSLGVWSLSRAGGLTYRQIDMFAWALLISHTVIVSRVRDPRVLAQDTGLTPEITMEMSIWVLCLLYAGCRFLGSLALLKNCAGPSARIALLLLFAAVVSTTYSASPLITLAWSLKLLTIIALACLLFDSSEPRQSCTHFIKATVLGLSLMLFQFLALAATDPVAAADRGGITGMFRLGGYLLPATQLSSVSGMLCVLLLVSHLSGSSSRSSLFALALAFCMMVASLGRAGMLASTVSTVVVLMLFRRLKIAGLLSASAGVLLLAIPGLLDFSWDIITRRQDVQQITSLTGRVPLWEKTIELIQMKPLLGWGYVAGGRVAILTVFREWIAPHSHNAFLEILLALGVLGGLILLALLYRTYTAVIKYLRYCWNPRNATPDAAAAVQVLALLIFLTIDGVFSAGFSGAPRFETTILIGCVFCTDQLTRIRRDGIG